MDYIRDDNVTSMPYYGYRDAAHWMVATIEDAKRFKLDLMHRQPLHIEVVCEAARMVPQLARVSHEYGIGVQSSSGFNSTTNKHDLAKAMAGEYSKPVHVLTIGDLDPSGNHIAKNLDEDVTAFIEHYSGHPVTFHRLAVLPDQVENYGLTTQPRQQNADGTWKDNRSYELDYTCQAEAIDTPLLARILRDGIEPLLDMDVLATARRAEKQIRGRLVKQIEAA
ncbi:hypothetical protein OAS39_10545 [Pirellulales bacterium]|nr:hypothetical protein [Pirellulales bacterium]